MAIAFSLSINISLEFPSHFQECRDVVETLEMSLLPVRAL